MKTFHCPKCAETRFYSVERYVVTYIAREDGWEQEELNYAPSEGSEEKRCASCGCLVDEDYHKDIGLLPKEEK